MKWLRTALTLGLTLLAFVANPANAANAANAADAADAANSASAASAVGDPSATNVADDASATSVAGAAGATGAPRAEASSIVSISLGADSIQGRDARFAGDIRLEQALRLLVSGGAVRFHNSGLQRATTFHLGLGSDPLLEWSGSAELEAWQVDHEMTALGFLGNIMWAPSTWIFSVLPALRSYRVDTQAPIDGKDTFRFTALTLGLQGSYYGLDPLFFKLMVEADLYSIDTRSLAADAAAGVYSATTLALDGNLLKNQAALEFGASLGHWMPSLELVASSSALDTSRARGLTAHVAYDGLLPMHLELDAGWMRFSTPQDTDKPVTTVQVQGGYSW
jgi:hypothetical protein